MTRVDNPIGREWGTYRPSPTHRLRAQSLLLLLLGAACPSRAQVGMHLESVEGPAAHYRNVVVMAATPSTVTIRHPGGIAQLALEQLSPDLQERFGYDREKAQAHRRQMEAELETQAAASLQRDQEGKQLRQRYRTIGAVGRALARFGTRPSLRPVDLRSDFMALDIGAKNQGRQPSCAVFAIVGALEYENARVAGRIEKFSEDYLIWATRRASGRQLGADGGGSRGFFSASYDDIGFSLEEVLVALRAYGIPAAAEMPNVSGARMSQIQEPEASVVDSARNHRRIFSESIPGVQASVRIDNILHVLNEGVPVVVGFFWPHLRSRAQSNIRTVDGPSFGQHAVTLVGYVSDSGTREGVRFIFRNSWGSQWGVEGYGTIELGYLQRCLTSAAVVDVQPTGG